MDGQSVVSSASLVVGLAGLCVAIFESMRRRQVKQSLDAIKRTRHVEIWTNIGIIIQSFDSINEARELLLADPACSPTVLNDVTSARRGIVDSWRHLLAQASLEEPTYDIDTIRRWWRAGRLENEWRVQQAIRLLPTSQIPADPLQAVMTTPSSAPPSRLEEAV